jgi:hypothetical protein
MNGLIYLAAGVLLLVWPGLTQTLFMDRAFVENEQGLVRVVGLTVVVIGWLYLFGGRSGARQVVGASVIDRLIFVPVVLVPLVGAKAKELRYIAVRSEDTAPTIEPIGPLSLQ